MSTAELDAIPEGLTVRVRRGVDLFLPRGSFTVFFGRHDQPALLRVDKPFSQPDWESQPGNWLLNNRARGSYGHSETLHLADLSVSKVTLSTNRRDAFADNLEPHWIDRVLIETPT